MSESRRYTETARPPRSDPDDAWMAARWGLGVFGVVFAIMWGPVYVAGYGGLLLLFPIFFVVWAASAVLGLMAVVFAVSSLRRGRPGWGALAVGVGLIVVAPVVLWFGATPLVLLGLWTP